MKKNYFFAGLFCSAFLGFSAHAQKVNDDAFLKGDYVEVGIAKNGAFGTFEDAPAGYHQRGGGINPNKLGFVADPDKDGWDVGVPTYIGDYFVPGSPQEGWDMQLADGTWARGWNGPSGLLTGGIVGKVTTYNATGAFTEGIWEGTLAGMTIRAVTKLKKDKLYFTTTVKITNTTSKTMYNFYYDRTVDPDNEVETPGGGSYETDNTIVYKLPSPNNKTLIKAVGLSLKSYLGLASRDCRARPYISGGGSLTPTDSLHILFRGNGLSSAIVKQDSTLRQDCGIGIVFKIDSLRAGDSTYLSYAYVLSEADVDSAFEDLKPVMNVNGLVFQSGDTVKACNGKVIDFQIVGGESYKWSWSPDVGLSDTNGARIKVKVDPAITTYTATAVSDLCPIPPITITVDPIANPDKPKVVTPLYYCQYASADPLTATPLPGSTLLYYAAATGGAGAASLVPATIIPGSKYYYVSQVSPAGCESQRERIEIIARRLPTVSVLSKTDPTYCAAPDASITLQADSAFAVYTVAYDKDGVPATPVSITTDASGRYTLTGLKGGSYTTFTITNKYGCKSIAYYGPVDLVDPAPPGPPVTNNGPLCVNVEAVLTAPFIADATYSWTGPDGFSSTDRNPTFTTTENSGGTYTLRVQVGECIYKPSTTNLIITPTPKHQQFNDIYVLCQNTDLVVNVLREPGITYIWSGNGINQVDQPLKISNVQFSDVGRYYLTASTDNGCTATDSLVLQVDKRPSFAIVSDTAVCAVDSAALFVNSDAPSIKWSPATGLGRPESFVTKAKPEQTTTYTATVASGNACPDTSGKVTVGVIPTPSVRGYDTTVRMNIPYTVLPVFSEDVVKWIWEPTDSLSCGNCPAPVFNSSRDMTYVVKGVNKEGCVGRDEVTVRVFCDGANVTMPNAFTPNGDGSNDVFYVRGTGFTVKSFSIYNRLGQLVFSRENFLPNDPRSGWDGTQNGQQVSDAAGFVYMLEAVCLNSKNAPILIKGTVLMIK
ncbi:MAG TPA: gliding motility-associated C-terminal domain-containing protein [Chitinophagaceae bacterium]|nr:gliding motility-associated C-terminal domain-containing protein [Chitinophagaceae bacterium]